MNPDDELKNPERTRRYEEDIHDVDPDDAGRIIMVGFKTLSKKFSTVVSIMAEVFGPETQAKLRKALEVGHGITFGPEDDPDLWFVVSQDQVEALKEHDIPAPTFVQLLGTCEVVGLTEESAINRFRAIKENA